MQQLIDWYVQRESLDIYQLAVVKDLQNLLDRWENYITQQKNWLKFMRSLPIPQSIYLYGSVGSGKTMLMDRFYTEVSTLAKWRVHFHGFMQYIHKALNDYKGKPDPLVSVAQKLSRQYQVICLDEFYVKVISDAMILGHLLSKLDQTMIFITSNIAPADLYHNGLNRERFMPTIALIQKRFKVIELNTEKDYRFVSSKIEQIYNYPLSPVVSERLNQIYLNLLGQEVEELIPEIQLFSRTIQAYKRATTCIWLEFKEICVGNYAQSDYLYLARAYDTVIISDVMQFNDDQQQAAMRFILLIDVLYDQKVKCIFSASHSLDELYVGKQLRPEFLRTASRIHEMQTPLYLTQRGKQKSGKMIG